MANMLATPPSLLGQIHTTFLIPTWYAIPAPELLRYQGYMTEAYPLLARILDCDTTIDCECFACVNGQ